MPLAKCAYYANPHRPGIAVRAVLRDPLALDLLRALRAGALPLAALAPTLPERQVLRRLVRLDLVSVYEVSGASRYRLRRLSPRFARLLDAGPAAA